MRKKQAIPQERFVRLGKITTPYGGKTTQEKFHPGVDIANANGTPIKAPVSGTVEKVVTGIQDGANNFGNTLVIEDGKGNIHEFHHLSAILAKPGQTVKQGQVVMKMGASGAAYSPSNGDASNLDYRIVNAHRKYINPEPYLKNL